MMAPNNPTYEEIMLIIFNYYPSEAAAGIFFALFFVATLWNGVITYRTKSLFMAWVAITGLFEVGGWVAAGGGGDI